MTEQYFPNEKQKSAYLDKIKSKLSDRIKPVISLLIKEKYKPGDVTDEEAIELHYVREMAEQAAKDAESGKSYGYMSFEEFSAKERGA
ncbi:hypothetical protein P886_0522 [Alteromonadaceae bacterium 2753L.S.0a.02]|nr:hypothetical protein P886_0522 [Alteromonadaceae bacterium 2753L.S.0a.02]